MSATRSLQRPTLAAGATARVKTFRIEGDQAGLAAALLVLAEESA